MLYSRLLLRASICGLLLLLLGVGCGKQGTSPGGGNAVVQCRAVIVLAQGDTLTVPNQVSTNTACRLTMAQVQSYITALQAYGPRYGNNCSFVFGPVTTWTSPNYNARPYDFSNGWILKDMNTAWPQHDPGWDSQMINIYFVGDIRDMTHPSGVLNGNTVDPSDSAAINQDIMPHIFISDRDFPEFGSHVTVTLTDHAFEHEMCHFLLRQRVGINQPARYNTQEHDPNNGATHLMRRQTPHGDINKDDVVDTSARVINNRYLIP